MKKLYACRVADQIVTVKRRKRVAEKKGKKVAKRLLGRKVDWYETCVFRIR